jgi:drug/metabolite transporter (DMT)-like permease
MKLRHIGLLLFLGAVFGSAFPFIQLGLQSFAPLTLVGLRLGGAALVLAVVLVLQRQRFPASLKVWRDMLIVGVIGLALPVFLITWGEQYISAGLAAIIIATTPLFTSLLAFVWMRADRLGWAHVLGMLLGFVGVAVALGVVQLDIALGSGWAQLAVVLGAVCYAFQGLYSQKTLRDQPALVTAAGATAAGALVTLPAALVLEGLPTTTPTAQAMLGLLSLILLCSALAYVLFFWLLERIGAARSSMVTYLVPIFALFLGWMWLGEQIGAHAVVGLMLVLAGLLVASEWRGKRMPRPALPQAKSSQPLSDVH